MKKLIKKIRVSLMKSFPEVYVLLAGVVTKGMFQKERKYLAGKLQSTSDFPPVYQFVYNRCGSRYICTIINTLLSNKSVQHVDIGKYIAHCLKGDQSLVHEKDSFNNKFNESGFLYAPFYFIPDGFSYDDLQKGKRIILNLRDPRDVLTSRYFSQAYSHTLMQKKHIGRREQVKKMTIDEFVIAELDEIKERYQSYFTHLVGRPDVLFLPYERMVLNFEGWLSDLSDFLNISKDSEGYKSVLASADFKVDAENQFAHRRSVQPGNHKEKLKPETIALIMERMGEYVTPFQEELDKHQKNV